MPHFAYKARTRTGEKAEGLIEAPDRRAAVSRLESQGYIPVSVTEGAAPPRARKPRRLSPAGRGPRRMSTRDVLIFTTEVSDLIGAGMTLGGALNVLSGRRTGRAGDRIIAELRDAILQGSSLSDALARHPKTFSALHVSMVRAGEASGALSEVLRRLVEHYERMQDVREKVVMALVYPCIVLAMGMVTLVFSMLFVIPKFKVIFDSLGDSLPLPTRMLIALSGFLLKYGWAVAIGTVAAVTAATRAIRTEKGTLWWDGFKLRLPLVRGVVSASVFANFARTLGTLLGNGVPVLKALTIVAQTVSNAVVAREINNARDRVTDGTTISGPLAAGSVFPEIMTEMLGIGERTGDMTGALTHIARRYENELDRSVKVFTTALEPILILLVAVVVGFVAVSILMAVFNMTSGLNV